MWFCVPTTNGGGLPDLACIYNYNNGTWTFDDIAWTCGIDRIPLSYPLFALDSFDLYALESTEDKAGIAYTGYVDSAEQGAGEPDIIKQVTTIYPVIETDTASHIRFQVGYRDNVNVAITWSAYYNLHPATDVKLDTRSAGSGRLWSIRITGNELDTPFKIGNVVCEVETAGSR